MIRRSVALAADSHLEGQVVSSFLEAADYQVTDLWYSPPTRERAAASVDIGVVILDGSGTPLVDACERVRSVVENPMLPIVAVVEQEPVTADDRRVVLIRPIRLYELVDAIEELAERVKSGQAAR